MNEDEINAKLDVLAQQQSMQTNAIKAALEARWAGGADTVTGWVIALDPSLEGSLDPKTPLY